MFYAISLLVLAARPEHRARLRRPVDRATCRGPAAFRGLALCRDGGANLTTQASSPAKADTGSLGHFPAARMFRWRPSHVSYMQRVAFGLVRTAAAGNDAGAAADSLGTLVGCWRSPGPLRSARWSTSLQPALYPCSRCAGVAHMAGRPPCAVIKQLMAWCGNRAQVISACGPSRHTRPSPWHQRHAAEQTRNRQGISVYANDARHGAGSLPDRRAPLYRRPCALPPEEWTGD